MLKNKLFAGAIFALALFVAGTVSAAYTFPSKIDTLQEKKDVQTVLNMSGANLTVDGVLGAKSISAIKTFQGSKNLEVDGLIGPMTRAALEAASVAGGTVVSTVPGCSAGALFSATTGAACTTVSTTVPGCTAGALFSATTGASCAGGTTVVVAGPLTGGAGAINTSVVTTDVNSYLVEGQADSKVLGFKVQATDSDVKISNLKVTLNHGTSAGSSYLDRYAANVSVWMNGVKVGSALATDFSKDVSGLYSKSIALDNAVVRMGVNNKATFYVTVTGAANIDSTDMSAVWNILVDNFRFQDATGVIMSFTPSTALTSNLTVKDINGTGDVKLVISKETSSPIAQTVKVSNTASTSDIPMLVFKLKNTGADMTFDAMSFTVNASTSPLAMIGELTLKEGGNTVATWTPTSATTGAQTVTFSLDNTYNLPKDSTKTFTVVAKINDIDNFTAGTLTVSYLSASYEVASTRTTLTSVSGSAVGETQTFFSTGAAVKFVSESYTAAVSGTNPTEGSVAITFTVEAVGDNDVVINENGSDVVTTLTQGGTPLAQTTGNTIVAESGITATGGLFTVSSGDVKTFTVTRRFSYVPGFVVMTLNSVDGSLVSNVKTAAH